jgi:DNA (cytosine-5)-methyltransferase 1
MLTYISLFSCAGVGCYGFKQQDFQCIATNELIQKRLDVQKANDKCKYGTGYIQGSISDQAIKDAIMQEIEMWKDKENLIDVDVLVATPPCQGMSNSNRLSKKNAVNETPRNSLVIDAIQMVEKIKPKFFLFENVPAFPNTPCLDTDNTFKPINVAIHTHLSMDYDILFEPMDFLDYGSNSSRMRCLTLGIRKDLIGDNFLFNSVNLKSILPKKKKPNTIRQCIGHLKSLNRDEWDTEDLLHFAPELPDRHIYWIEKVKEGESASNQEDLDRRPPTTSIDEWSKRRFVRAYWDKPSTTILTNSKGLSSQGKIHPKDNRSFSIREIMIFQTIPNEFKWFEESMTKENIMKKEILIRECIGESVPTSIFNQIAQNIKNFLQ